MGVKISELPGTESVSIYDKLILNHDSATCQVDVDTVLANYLSECLGDYGTMQK